MFFYINLHKIAYHILTRKTIYISLIDLQLIKFANLCCGIICNDTFNGANGKLINKSQIRSRAKRCASYGSY